MAKKKATSAVAEPVSAAAIQDLLAQPAVGYDPNQLTLGKNYSRFGEFTADQVYGMANSLKLDGQLQPIIIDGAGNVLSGNLRTLGARYLRENDPECAEFQIYAVTVPETFGLTARRINIAENLERENLTPVDIMQLCQQIVTDAEEEAGEPLEEKKAAEAVLSELGRENNGDNRKWVLRHLRLVKVPDTVREQIHNRSMALDAGLVFAEAIEAGMSEETVTAAAEEAAAEGEKVTRTRAERAVKQAGGAAAGAKGVSKPEFVKMLAYLHQNSKSEGARAIAKIVLNYITGSSSDMGEPEVLRAIQALAVPEVKGQYAKYAKLEPQVSEPEAGAKGKGKKAA